MDPLETARVLIQENTPAYVGYVTTVHEPKEQGPAAEAPEIWKPIDKRKTTTLPSFLQEYSDVFSEKGAKRQPLLRDTEHKIKLLLGTEPPHGPNYPLSAESLETLRKYIAKNIENGRITPSTGPAGPPVLFVPKNNGTLRLYIDYKGPYGPIKLAKYFLKINLRDTFHRIRVNPGDRWKTGFRT